MATNELVHELNARVTALEVRQDAAEREMQRLQHEIDQCRADHTMNNNEVKRKVEALESLVDDLRLNTMLTKQIAETLELLRGQLERTEAQLETIKAEQGEQRQEWAKMKGWIGGVTFVATCAWGLLATFKDQLIDLLHRLF